MEFNRFTDIQRGNQQLLEKIRAYQKHTNKKIPHINGINDQHLKLIEYAYKQVVPNKILNHYFESKKNTNIPRKRGNCDSTKQINTHPTASAIEVSDEKEKNPHFTNFNQAQKQQKRSKTEPKKDWRQIKEERCRLAQLKRQEEAEREARNQKIIAEKGRRLREKIKKELEAWRLQKELEEERRLQEQYRERMKKTQEIIEARNHKKIAEYLRKTLIDAKERELYEQKIRNLNEWKRQKKIEEERKQQEKEDRRKQEEKRRKIKEKEREKKRKEIEDWRFRKLEKEVKELKEMERIRLEEQAKIMKQRNTLVKKRSDEKSDKNRIKTHDNKDNPLSTKTLIAKESMHMTRDPNAVSSTQNMSSQNIPTKLTVQYIANDSTPHLQSDDSNYEDYSDDFCEESEKSSVIEEEVEQSLEVESDHMKNNALKVVSKVLKMAVKEEIGHILNNFREQRLDDMLKEYECLTQMQHEQISGTDSESKTTNDKIKVLVDYTLCDEEDIKEQLDFDDNNSFSSN